ncbi:unnamed protein product, partial [Vitis vinifera]
MFSHNAIENIIETFLIPYPVSLFMSLDHWREFPIDADDDEDSSQCPLSSPSETYLVGFVIVNIVGIQYYSGTISGRERVGLVREPLNPYDRNAIKVLNTTTIQVGHIDRSAAAVLAPLMDANLVTVEGIVPNTPGSGNRYRIPCQVHIFAQIEWFPRVRSAISRGGLQLISDSDPSFTLENSCELPPFWEKQNGSYVNVLTNYQTNKRPEPLRGGIFADDMGLGKTLTLLCLIAFDKCMSRKAISKTTLIVCPPSVFSTWVTQLLEHTTPKRLKVYMYYGNRTQEAEELQKYDIVLTTYSTLATEEAWSGSPVKKIEWWRVILDEAHMIKNVNAQQSQAVTNLRAKRRWVVTGTPIQNGTFDLFSLMAFLRFEPFSIKSYWQSLVQRPLGQGKEKGLSRLQVLMATISLRRTKDKGLIGLPPKSVETCFVELSAEERELYDQMEAEGKCVIRDYIDAGSVMRNYSTVLGIILRLRQICTDVALCPSDLRSLLLSNNIEVSVNSISASNKAKSMGSKFQACGFVASVKAVIWKWFIISRMLEEFEDGLKNHPKKRFYSCKMVPLGPHGPIDTISNACFHQKKKKKHPNPPKPPSLINSRHLSHLKLSLKLRLLLQMFCLSSQENKNTKLLKKMVLVLQDGEDFDCPICISPPTNIVITCYNSEIPSSECTSSKVLTLLKFLSASRDQNPSTKSVVFSQFRKMLLLLEQPLKAAVLLASLKASGAGINLTAASRVYLLEPWWNPAVEEQAMDRVHRIGQKEDVKIVRLIARNSIEERILELQERKKKLAKEAFGRRGLKDRREVGVEDLRMLMSLLLVSAY